MYTGETAFLRVHENQPGPKVLGLGLLHLRSPANRLAGMGAASAATIFAAVAGNSPEAQIKERCWPGDMSALPAVIFVLCFGGTSRTGAGKDSTFIVLWIAFFLLVFNVIFVPEERGGRFSWALPIWRDAEGADWLLLGAFAAYSGTGGLGNIFTKLDAG